MDLKEQYEKNLEKTLNDFSQLDISEDPKTYGVILKEMNAGVKQYLEYSDKERDYEPGLEREEEKLALERDKYELDKQRFELSEKQSDRDYLTDMRRDAEKYELEQKKLENEQAERKAERRARFWDGAIRFMTTLTTAGAGIFTAWVGWRTALQMQKNAIDEDREDILPRSPAHKHVPRGDFKVHL